MILSIIVLFLSIFVMIIYIIITILNDKITIQEKNIQKILKQRSDLIPSLYEISRKHINKHKEVFNELISLRKIQFSLNEFEVSFIEFIKNEISLNHEIRFIYNICINNKELQNDKDFLYIKKLVIEKNKLIGQNIENYKKNIKFVNNLVKIKNYTILGLFIPSQKRLEFNLLKNIF
ncbi:MAG: LemA family protein [Candidatus Gracilibacteria bacterium]|nr:LemA family protein [Candidatus Gracilibacteria bacterium]